MGYVYALRIRVRTEETRFTNRAFMLASSRAPLKPVGSALVVQPTARVVSLLVTAERGGGGVGG
jgi:hypothetical protein